MPSLAIDARMINSSGIGVYLRNIIPFLSQEYNLVLMGDEKELTTLKALPNVRISQALAPIYSVKEQLEIKKKLPPCDLFWSPHYNVPLLPIRARKRVVTIHDVYHLAYQHTLTLPQKLYANFLIRAATKLSDKIITVSDFSKNEIIKYSKVAADAIVTIHNGVDAERFSSIKSNSPKLSQPDAEKYILFVGNVKPHKNLFTLLKAFSHLLDEGMSSFNLVIAGKKEGFITADTQVAKMIDASPMLKKRITFTGFVTDKDLPQLYQNASALVFPSVYEGFGLPPLEAMASGCPVVASSAGSIPEVCGDATVYFDPLDYLSLANKLRQVLGSEELRLELIDKGYNKVKQFTWEKTAQKHLEVFRQLTLN
jgi:glycosyltransferase involved in cell wall biosynthesis